MVKEDEFIYENACSERTSDVCTSTTITQRDPNVHGVWNTLGSRCVH